MEVILNSSALLYSVQMIELELNKTNINRKDIQKKINKIRKMLICGRKSKPDLIEYFIQNLAYYYQLNINKFFVSRERSYVKVRNSLIYYLYYNENLTLQQIGKRLHKDHSTINHAKSSIAEFIELDYQDIIEIFEFIKFLKKKYIEKYDGSTIQYNN